MTIRSTLLAAAFGATILAAPALAEQPGKDWMPMDEVFKTLTQAGYTDIRELEADNGHWEGKALKDGHLVEFHADSRTGAVTKEKVKDGERDASKGSDSDVD